MKTSISSSINEANEEEAPDHKIISHRKKALFITVISLTNGILYFLIAVDGGQNIEDLFGVSGKTADIIIYSAGVGASLVYTMFTYKTFEALSLKMDSFSKKTLAFLAPLAAAAFLTAGADGARLIGCNDGVAITLGLSLFFLRIINCVDASVKFPDRLLETKRAWNDARSAGDNREMTRLVVIWIASIGYVICTTDAIFAAFQTIFGWFGIPSEISAPISYMICGFGAIGTLPLNVYWSYRGLRQLTYGGKVNAAGENPDPTDRYTYLGLVLVTPVMLGILGGATAATGAVFGHFGVFSQVVRVVTSVFYAACAGTPGMATLLRSASSYVKNLCCREKTPDLLEPLLEGMEGRSDQITPPLSSNPQSSFSGKEKEAGDAKNPAKGWSFLPRFW